MKKIFFTMLCAAVMISCNGNKAKSDACTDCSGDKTECTHQHGECDGTHEDCSGECDGSGNCKKSTECDKNRECDNSAECTSNAPQLDTNIGCIQTDNNLFLSKIADYKNPEWKYLGDKPAIIDFYADWCGPCKKIAPSLDEVAKEYAGKLYVYKVNVDNCREIAEAYGISSIPTLFFVPVDGAPIKAIGMMEKSDIEANSAQMP